MKRICKLQRNMVLKLGNMYKIVFTPEQLSYIKENYSDQKNIDIANHLGVSRTTIRRYGRQLGLSKSDEFNKRVQREAALKAAAISREMGGNSGMRNLLIYGVKYRFTKDTNIRERMGEEAYNKMLKKRGEKMREMYDKERRRVLFGLEQKTKLKVTKCPAEKIEIRRSLRKKGYEVSRASNEAYITPSTKRSNKLEGRAIKFGISFYIKGLNQLLLIDKPKNL